jgi:hypothetical protein
MVCVTNMSASSWCCTEDGSGPPGAGLQEQASNRPVLLRSKGEVVSDWRKGITGCQVGIEKMSESEPSMTHRYCPQGTAKTGVDHWPWDQSGRYLLTDPMAVGV